MREMKNSGIEWIGGIPNTWTIKRMLYCLDSVVDYRGKTPEKVDEGILLVTAKNIKDGKIDYEISREYVREELYDEIMHRGKLKIGDVLFTTEAPLGEVANVDSTNFALAQRVIKFRADDTKLDNYYLKYCLMAPNTQQFLQMLSSGSTAAGIKASKLPLIKIPLPDIDPQRKIVSFLNDVCLNIDKIASDIQHQIELLQEYKQSVITEAVTKGLDKNVAMKDSGIEWIGNIPENWSVKPIKYLYTVYSGATPKSNDIDNWDGDITWITPADFKTEDKYISSGSRNITTKGYKSCNTNLVPENSIIFSKRAPIGTVALSKGMLCTNQGCLACVNNDSSNSLYYYYLMSVLTEQFILYGSGTTFMEISTSNFENFKVVVPPKTEQDKISNYLDKKCNYIDTTIFDKQKQLDTLTEYKKSLIYEYVTGKKEVPADA
ncbi:hypothetical protein FZ041_11205 [Selenomonas caprae]|uniref:Type I restriction modification DNA specificity domain-containing protein n=1 Tax=Selenomonas caprae TaxID=2606905 RepID=A0A5D6WK01_9FIRM|nr:restriction endonuclease subunit S [Selenomonas caprae]TYZ27455.1 hypothetical protein FZ041_11205 [Selenomonas caprae]